MEVLFEFHNLHFLKYNQRKVSFFFFYFNHCVGTEVKLFRLQGALLKHDTARFSVPTYERIIQESGSKIEEVPTLGIVPQFTPKTYQPQVYGS